MTTGRTARPGTALFGLLPVVLAAIVYRGIPGVYFYADDFVHLFDIENIGFLRFIAQIFGGHVYVVRNVIFYAMSRVAGLEPQPYYALAFATHLLNVWLVFRVARRLTDGNGAIAALAAALWGTCPLAAGTIGWYTAYGHELVAVVLLVCLDGVLASEAAPSWTRLAAWGALLLAGATCFGVGIGVAIAFPVVVVLCRPAIRRDELACVGLLLFPLVVVALYFGYRRLYETLVPLPMSEAVMRNLALTQSAPIVDMFQHLVKFAVAATVGGFAFDVDQYPTTYAHRIVRAYAAGLVIALVVGGSATRRRLLALAAVCVATYVMIALGRSNVYRVFNVEPWDAARVARYHYVGLVPIALAAAVALHALTRGSRRASLVLLVAWLAFASSRYLRSTWTLDDHAAARQWVAAGAQRLDAAIDARPPGTTITIENEDAPRDVLGPVLGPTLFPGLAGLFVLLHPGNVVRGREVHLVERRAEVRAAWRDPRTNRRLADLLVDGAAPTGDGASPWPPSGVAR